MTIFLANLLFLITLVLVAVVGSIVQTADLAWGLLVTEFGLILLPTLLLLRLRKLPLKATLGWRWPGWGVALGAFFAGAGVNAASTPLSLLSIAVFGYTVTFPLPGFAENPLQASLFFLALVAAAPLCEEVLFRGAIQNAYARLGKWEGILVPAVLFSFYHMRLQGLLPLVPLALGLGWVMWRTRSLPAVMFFHAGANLIGGVSLFLNTAQTNPLEGGLNFSDPMLLAGLGAAVLVLCCPGIVLAVLGGFTIHRKSPPVIPPEPLPTPTRLRAYWPLIPAALVYVVMAGYEFISFKVPSLVGQTYEPTFSAPALAQPINLNYEVQTPFSDPTGAAECQLAPSSGLITLTCATQVTAFDVERNNSRWVSGDSQVDVTAHWDAASRILLDYHAVEVNVNGQTESGAGLLDNLFTLTINKPDGKLQDIVIPPSALLPEEWPWRLMALDFKAGKYIISYANPAHYTEADQMSAPRLEMADLTISKPEMVSVPAGEFKAWKVILKTGDNSFTAWYEQDAPHRLVKLEKFVVVYELVK